MADDMEIDQMDGAPKFDFAKVIGEKLQESIKKLDVVSLVQKMSEQVPQDEEGEAVQKKLKEVIERYNSMTEEEREEFGAIMKEALASKLARKMQDPNFDMSGLETAIQDAVKYQIMLVAAGVILFVILLVFFGYKLYKSIKDKELKREEKKKAKQMKKKK